MENGQEELKHVIVNIEKIGVVEDDLEEGGIRKPPPPSPPEVVHDKYKELKRVGEKIEKASTKLGEKAIKIAAYYILFLTIILVVISIPSTKLSTHKWIPFVLSLSISIVFGLTFTSIINKWERSCYYFDLNWLELEYMCYRMTLSASVMKKERMILKPDKFVVYQRYAFVYLTLSSLFGFTMVIFYACFNLL